MPDTKKGAQATHQGQKPKSKWWARLIYDIKSELYKGEAERKEENSQDRSSRRTATATVWIAFVTLGMGIFSGLTYWEIHTGGVDSHNLAESTGAAARAWVVVRATKFGYLNDASGKAVASSIVELANTGPSPAFNVRGWRCAQVLNHEPSVSAEPKDIPDCVEDDIGMIGKDIPIPMHVNDLTQTVPKDSLSGDSHDPIGKHFYAWGYFTYDVASKDRRHFVSFCLLNSLDQLGACPHGNDGD